MEVVRTLFTVVVMFASLCFELGKLKRRRPISKFQKILEEKVTQAPFYALSCKYVLQDYVLLTRVATIIG